MIRKGVVRAVAVLAALLVGAAARAASLTWDGNGATAPNPNGGAGTWDVNTTASWWNGTTNVVWPAAGGTDDDAVFGNTAGTVSIASGGVTVNDMTFNTTGYVVQNNSLTFNGTTPTLTVGAGLTATINATMAAGAVTKAGTGTLYMNTLAAGATFIANGGTTYANTGGNIKGTVQINAGAVFRNTQPHVFDVNTSRVWVNGGTLTHGPATYPEYYVPHGTSASDPGVQMTGGSWDGENRFSSGSTAYLRINVAGATATIAGYVRTYQGGTQIYNVVGGTVPSGVDLAFTGILADNFGGGTTHVTKTGAGLMEISGTPTLNGPGLFTLSQGTLRLTGNALGSFGGTGVALSTNNAVTLQLNATDARTFAKPISGGSAGAVVSKIGAGALTLSAVHTYAGATTVNAGKLVVNGSVSGVVTVAGGTLAGSGSVGATTVAAGGTVEGGNSGSGTLTLASLTYNGAGKIQGYLGAATPIAVTGAVAANSGPGSLAVTALNVPADGTYHFLSYGAGPDPFAALHFAVPARSFTLVDNGASNVIDIAVHTGAYPVWTGALSTEWSTNALASPRNWVLNVGGEADFMTLDAVRFDDAHGAKTNVQVTAAVQPGSVTVDTTNAYTFAGQPIACSGALVKTGAGTLALANSNGYAQVSVRQGTLGLGAGGTSGWVSSGGALSISNGAWLAVNRSDAYLSTTFTTAGAGGFRKSGSGTLNVATPLRHAGDTVVSKGTLRLDAGAFSSGLAAGAGRIVIGDADTGASEARLAVWGYGPGWPPAAGYALTQPIVVSAGPSGRLVIARNGGTYAGLVSSLITLNNNVILRDDGGDRLSVDGRIVGTGNVTVEGDRVNFGAETNTFVGDITIAAGGVLQLNGNRTIPPATKVTVSGELRLNANAATAPSCNGLAGAGLVTSPYGGGQAVLTVGAGGGDGDFAGAIQGNLALTKAGAGTQTLRGLNTYTGPTTVTGGTLVLGAANTIGAASATVLNGGTLDMGSANNAVGTLQVAGASGLRLGAGTLAFAASAGQAWTGTLRLAGTLGPTTLRFGTDATGLTAAQLASIRYGIYSVSLTTSGYLQAATGTVFMVR